MSSASYPHRQLSRRLLRAGKRALSAVAALTLTVLAVSAGLATLAVVLALVAAACAVRSRHWWRLARRSAVGARSEQQVRTRLDCLVPDGWRIRHSLGWLGGGDVDHLAVAPGPLRLVFAIETKTRSYSSADLARIAAVARWQEQRQAGPSRRHAVPILCLAGRRGIERSESGVAVVSLDRLLPVMSRLAGMTPKPAFLR
jgi:Nuclease-related domain